MKETGRQGPIPVREMMAHLSEGGRAPDAAAPSKESRIEPAEVAFSHQGTTWTVREEGSATWGTDIGAAPVVVAVHFFHPDQPQRPAREALLPRGRLTGMHDSELAALLEASSEVPPEGTAPTHRRPGGGRSGRSGRGASARTRRSDRGGGRPARGESDASGSRGETRG
jgi:hypothetical protein